MGPVSRISPSSQGYALAITCVLLQGLCSAAAREALQPLCRAGWALSGVLSLSLLCLQEQQLPSLVLLCLPPPSLQISEQSCKVWLINSSLFLERGSLMPCVTSNSFIPGILSEDLGAC